MSRPLTPLIHIGMPKCGSTWLQKTLFTPEHGFQPLMETWQCSHTFIFPRPFEWRKPQLAEPDSDMQPVLSVETLSGNLLHGGRNAEIILHRLHDTFPEAKVLLIIREQYSMIRSIYNLAVNLGSPYPLRQLLKNAKENGTLHFSLEALKFHYIISAYQSAYGEEKLLVLPYELLSQDSKSFVSAICEFSEISYPENINLDTRQNPTRALSNLQLGRLLQRFWFKTRFNVNGLVERPNSTILKAPKQDLKTPTWLNQKLEAHFQKVLAEEIGDYFADSNSQTAALTGLDLQRYGYSFPEAY